MTDRTDRIPLAGDKARCEPSKTCMVRTRCARGIASLPKFGGSMHDYSTHTDGGTVQCPGYISAASIRIEQAPKREPKPWPKGED